MEPLRILHYPIHRSSGITNYVLQNWKFIDRTRFVFDFCTRFVPDETFRQTVGTKSRIYPFIETLENGLNPLISTLSEAIDAGCDVLHLHTCHLFGGFPLEELAVKKGVPRIIIHAHNSGLDRTFSPANEEELLRRHEYYKERITPAVATDFCACSEAAAEWLYGPQIPRNRIVYLNNAIDTQKFRFCVKRRNEVRAELGITDNFVIGHVGRFTQQKNHVFLLKIFRAVLAKKPNARLVLVGDGPLFEVIRYEAADLGNRVLFLGEQEDVASLMQAFDAFVLPSLYEGLPIVLIEAQAAGLVCVVSDTVSQEAKVTKKYFVMQLNLSESDWANMVCDAAILDKRKDISGDVAAAGYEIRKSVILLEQLYSGNLSLSETYCGLK